MRLRRQPIVSHGSDSSTANMAAFLQAGIEVWMYAPHCQHKEQTLRQTAVAPGRETFSRT